MPLMASLSCSTRAASADRSSCHCRHMVLTGESGSSKVTVAMPSLSWYLMVFMKVCLLWKVLETRHREAEGRGDP